MSARLKGWHKLKDLHDEDAYYVEGEVMMRVHGEVLDDVCKQAILTERARLAELVYELYMRTPHEAAEQTRYILLDEVLALLKGDEL